MDFQTVERKLATAITGEVRFDKAAKIAYSVDASIYEIEPLGIVIPRTTQEVLTILDIAREYQLPLIPRGAATGITGGCVGRALIIDLSRYLTEIIEINCEQKYVICQPGVVQDDLNQRLASYGYRLGPDTSTGNRATIGGMLANNAAGARSLRYGKMVDHILSVDLALASGEIITLQELGDKAARAKLTQDNIEGNIYRTIEKIRTQYSNEIENRFPKIPRRVSGYNLDELLKSGPLNLSKLIAGSEGTFGIALQIKLRIVSKERYTALCVIHFNDLLTAFEQSHDMLSFTPLSLEMIDHRIIKMGRLNPSLKNKLNWLIGDPAAVIVAEFEGETPSNVLDILSQFETAMRQKKCGYAYALLDTPDRMSLVWELRKAGLGLLLSKRTYNRAIAFIEDMSLPPPLLENLRLSPSTRQKHIDTFLDFTPEGGIELAADLCNGNGLCRKSEK